MPLSRYAFLSNPLTSLPVQSMKDSGDGAVQEAAVCGCPDLPAESGTQLFPLWAMRSTPKTLKQKKP